MYQYPGSGTNEYLYHPTGTYTGPLATCNLSDAEVMQSIGATVLIGSATVTRHRIRTRCQQARLVITVNREDGSLVHAFDVLDLDPRVGESVVHDPADWEAYRATLMIDA